MSERPPHQPDTGRGSPETPSSQPCHIRWNLNPKACSTVPGPDLHRAPQPESPAGFPPAPRSVPVGRRHHGHQALRHWSRGLRADMHGALLVTGIPEGLEEEAVEAVLQPAFLPPPPRHVQAVQY